MKNIDKIKTEQFIRFFCKEKGWNVNELTTNQMLIIINKKNSLK